MLRAAVPLLVLLCLACSKGGSAPAHTQTPAPEPTFSASEASTRPFAINPDPDPPRGNSVLTDARAARHDENGGFDRIVFEFRDSLPGAQIEYVDEVVGCGSGQHIPMPSNTILLVRFASAQGHDDAGKVTTKTSLPAVGPSILGARQVCDFEGELTWALPVNGKKPFAVATLKAPPRLVIDVKN